MSEDRIEALANSLGVSPAPRDGESLRREIRAELSVLHPDRNEGNFADSESRERFEQLSHALVELDGGQRSTALVPLDTVAPMVSAIMDALGQSGHLSLRAGETSVVSQRQEILTAAKEEARDRFRLSRIGSGAIASVMSITWILPTLVAATGSQNVTMALEASFVAPIFAHALFQPIGFGLALYAWLFFALTWFMEQNDLARIDRITTEKFRGFLLQRAVLKARQRGDADTVTRADLREALDRRLRPAWVLRLLGARDVSPSFLDQVVDLHVTQLLLQRVVTPTEGVSLTPRYLVDAEVSKGIAPS